MAKFKIRLWSRSLQALVCLILTICIAQSTCPYPYQRCLCTTGSTPYCPCSQITSIPPYTTTSKTYQSHLVSLTGYGCRPCPSSCKRCSSTQICLDCFDQFQLIVNYCQACPISCKKCRLGVCQSCIDGYYIDYQQKCQKCPLVGTKTCTIDSLLSCQANYWMDNNGATCVNCDANCKTCSSTTKCSQCLDGFYESGYVCYKCKDQCQTCQNSTACITCNLNGYFFNSTQIACIPCPSSNCIRCNSNGTCSQCDSVNGYYLDKTSKLCQKYSGTAVQNCKNLTLTSSTYNCENCTDGYYALTDFTNASQLICYYGCSILCNRCSGPHYGLCDECVSQTDFTLSNKHCVPRYNLNDGSAFQLFSTAYNNVSFFEAPILISPDSCWHEYAKGGSSSVTVRLSKLGVYKMVLKWKVYKYGFFNSSLISQGTYSVQITNTLISSSNTTISNSFTSKVCQTRSGFSSLCSIGSISHCIDKKSMQLQGLITSTPNVITFTSPNSLIAISELLIIGYRCGGVYGQGCIQCTDINTCTRCENKDYYMIQQKCTSQCPNSYYTYQQLKKCVQICPSGSYSDDILHQCFTCVTPCQTCSSIKECITCKQGYYYDGLTETCLLQCPKRYYKNSYRRVCEKCSNPCFQCMDSVVCLSCREGFLNVLGQVNDLTGNLTIPVGECVLQCPDGLYTDLSTMRCQKCSTPCNTCSLLSTKCTSCIANNYFLNSKCLPQCPLNYFPNSTILQCQQCDSSCLNCHNLTYCIQCQLGFYLDSTSSCVTSCPQGYYQEQVLKQCLLCSQNCSTCNSLTICTSCLQQFVFFQENYSCVLQCPQFYYSTAVPQVNTSNVCQRCHLPCYQCTSEAQCLSCYDAFLYNGSCLLTCPSGYFENVANLECSLCDQDYCLECKNSPRKCTKCKDGLLLVNSECLLQCPAGFYFSAYKGECILCQGLCESCINATYCTSCISGFSLVNDTGDCINVCQAGYYKVKNSTISQFSCVLCPSSCNLCEYNYTLSSVQCLSCSQGYYLYNGTCNLTCPDGFFGISGSCLQCSSPCSKCTDDEYCLSCLDGYGYWYEGACITECPYGFYPKQGACQQCDPTCLLCSKNATNCLACTSGLLLFSSYTNQSSNTHTQSVCLSSCPQGYFSYESSLDYDSMCQKCSQNCMNCEGQEENCTSCKSSYVLYQGRCVTECPLTTYINTTATTCIPCVQNCFYCLNLTMCLQCLQDYSLTANNACIQQCPFDQFSSEGMCKDCLYPCMSCIEQQKCLSCKVGVLFSFQCVDYCPQGSYYTILNGSQYCLPCAVNCSRCISSTQCLLCDNGLLLFNSSCNQYCPDGFYANYGLCVQCQEYCRTCQNSYSCFTCKKGAYFYQNKCITYCPIGYFASITAITLGNNIMLQQQVCQPCDIRCRKCYNTSTQCTECTQGYYLWIDSCVLTCPSGTYHSIQLQLCQPCISPCQTCSNAYSCETCIYSYLLYRQYSRNQCVQGPNCPNNYFLNVQQKVCEFICPQTYYVANSTRTCSLSCPQGLVTLEANRSCLQQCPQSMWIDQNLVCQQNETRPQNLPYLNCQTLLVRNLFFLECKTTMEVSNIERLEVKDFSINIGQVLKIKVKDNLCFYLLITSIERTLKNEYIKLTLNNKYQLRSISGAVLSSNAVSNQQISESLYTIPPQIANSSTTTPSYPVQNYQSLILVQQFIPFTIDQRQIGINFAQIAQSISYAALILWFFSLLKNLKMVSLLLIINLQWLFSLSFLFQNSALAPNVNQFLEGFKFSALFGMNEGNSQQNDLMWRFDAVEKAQFWSIHNYYDLKSSLQTVYMLTGVFMAIYLLTMLISRIFDEKVLGANSEVLSKIGKKSQIINERFIFNYFCQLALIIATPISLSINIQLTKPNTEGFIQFVILFLLYLAFIIVTAYFFTKWKSENKKKHAIRMMVFFYICFITVIMQSIIIIWSSFYFYIGFGVASIVLNIIAWNFLFKKLQPQRCSYLQLMEILKGLILVVLIIGDIKRESWSREEMFYFGFLQIGMCFVVILLSAIFIAQELFRGELSFKSKAQKSLKESFLKQKSHKTSNSPRDYLPGKEKSGNEIATFSQQDEGQMEQEQSFFSNKTPLQSEDDESSADIIDFDESAAGQSRNQDKANNQHKANVPPKNLFKYHKNQ